jgi:hypothetical protein
LFFVFVLPSTQEHRGSLATAPAILEVAEGMLAKQSICPRWPAASVVGFAAISRVASRVPRLDEILLNAVAKC